MHTTIAEPREPAVPPPESRRLRMEVAVFLLLVLSSIIPGWLASGTIPFTSLAIAVVLHDVALVTLVVFFAWTAGQKVSSLGWSARHPLREIGLGLVLYVPLFVILALLQALLAALGLKSPELETYLVPSSRLEIALACILVVVVAVSEETLFRGYLLPRLRAITRSTPLAVGLASLVFASGHVYEGASGILLVLVMAIAFSYVYLWRGSLVAPIVMHFIQDFLGLVLAPWLR